MLRLSFRCFFVVSIILVTSCHSSDISESEIQNAVVSGQFSKAEELIERQMSRLKAVEDSDEIKQLKAHQERMYRLKLEFSESEDTVRKQLLVYYPHLSDSLMEKWEKSGDLEMMTIDSEKRYFNRAVSNLFRINREAIALKKSRDQKDTQGGDSFKKRYLTQLFSENKIKKGIPFDQHTIQVEYTVSLKPNVVPAGEKVSCWLPFPRTNSSRLTDIGFISANDDEYIIASDDYQQRSIYMEKEAREDSALEFNVVYRFKTSGIWWNIQPEEVLDYDKDSELYQKYTAEYPPQIIFSDIIKKQAAEIVGTETNPYNQVKLLYYWLNDHIPWAGALEYSVMDCIPEYVLKNSHGDCGMQTFLFLSMARSIGIPCKWQSGWFILPEGKNLHDWCEVYYNGIGWVPVDVSFKLVDSPDQRIHEFYLNGMDSYRLIVNDDVSKEFFPKKKFTRSEPYDFQRGELEWRKGNLYFDKWSYHMNISVLK